MKHFKIESNGKIFITFQKKISDALKRTEYICGKYFCENISKITTLEA